MHRIETYMVHWHGERPELIMITATFASPTEALTAEIDKLKVEMEPWIKEAKAALDTVDLYRGGGVLKLAELMRKLSACEGLRAAYRNYEKSPA